MTESFMQKHIRKVVFLLFFFSGIAGLIYEIVWTRRLTLVFGSTTFAISTVLAAYMGGLALGSFLFGKWVDRRNDPLRMYGLLVIATGIYVLALPLLLLGVSPLYSLVYRAFGVNFVVLSFFRFLFTGLLLLIPATLMGGTLPVLSKFMTRHSETLRVNLGRLYALNTFGAVVGCFMAGFVLLPGIGMWKTTVVAVAIDIAAGLAALLLNSEAARMSPDEMHKAEAANLAKVVPPAARPQWLITIVLVLFGLSGFASLAYEILWTRLLVFIITNSIYAFSAMLTVFLLGIALGSYVFERCFRRARNLMAAFVIMEILIGVTGLLSIPILVSLRSFEGNISWLPSFWSSAAGVIIRAIAVMGLPTLLIGMVFPLANAIYARNVTAIGGQVGRAYAVNTLGSILGSVIAGFVLVPLVGTRVGIILVATLNIAIGLTAVTALALQRSRRAFVPFAAGSVAAVVLLVVVIPSSILPADSLAEVFTMDENGKVTYIDEGIGGTVTIEEFPAYRTISINGVNVAGTNKAFHTTQKLQAHLALLLHNNPRKVLQIGFGSGGTAYSASLHDVEKIDCVEISPVIIQAAPHFHETNEGVLSNPKVHVFIDDARSYMLHANEMYDVILSDSTHPVVAGNGALYTVDYFRLCYNRLKPDGIFSTWLPVYGMRSTDYKVILRSLREVFPHVYIWHTSVGKNEWTIVHGFKKPMVIDYETLSKHMAQDKVREDLHQIYVDSPIDLLALFVMDESPMRFYLFGTDKLNTDDNAYIEFMPARYSREGNRTRLFRESFCELMHFRMPVVNMLRINPGDENQVTEDLGLAYASTTSVLRGWFYQLWGDFPVGRLQYQYAVEIRPENKVAKDLLGMLEDNRDEILSRLKLDPDDSNLVVDLGEYYFLNGDRQTALVNFEKAIEMQPRNEYAYSRIVHCHILDRQFDKAMETTRRWENNVCLPTTREALRRYRDIVYDERAMAYTPEDIDLIARLAKLYLEILDFDSSRDYVSRGIEIDPGYLDILHSMAFIQRTLGDKSAGRTCMQILEQQPDDQYARETLAILRNGMSNPFAFFDFRREQIDDAEASQAASRDDPRNWFNLAMTAWENSQHAEAVSYLEKAIDEFPDQPSIYIDAATICLFIGEYDRGIEITGKAGKSIGDNKALKALEEKLWFQKALHSGHELSAEEYMHGATIYLINNEPEDGFPYLMKAYEMNPNLDYIDAQLGSYYMVTGQFEKAREYYDRALEKRPDDEKLKGLMRTLREKMGEKENPGDE